MTYDTDIIGPRIKCVHVKAGNDRRTVEIEGRGLAVIPEELAKETEEPSRTVRRTTVSVHKAMVLAVITISVQRRIPCEFPAVRLHRTEIGVVEGALNLIRPLRIVGYVEKFFTEAHPSCGNTGLL